MIYTVAIGGIAVLVALLVFFWKQVGAGSGRAFGHRIAAHLGIPKSLFHSLLVHGVKGSPTELLASLEKAKMGLDEASVALGPSLSRGIERMEDHFGPQEMVDKAKPVVAKLMVEFEKKP